MKKEKRAKFTKANILIPFQLLFFLSSSSSWFPFLCQVAKQISRFLWFPLREQDFDQGQKLFTKLNSKNSLIHSSNSSSNFFLSYASPLFLSLSFSFSMPSQSNSKNSRKREPLSVVQYPQTTNEERKQGQQGKSSIEDREKGEGSGGVVRFRRIDVALLVYSRVLGTVYALFNERLYLSSR